MVMMLLLLLFTTAAAMDPPPPNPAAEPTAEPSFLLEGTPQFTCFDPAHLPCVDCGKFPAPGGSFCDGDERPGRDGRWRGRACFAQPVGNTRPSAGQRTPMCNSCVARARAQTGRDLCHVCRGQPWATPPVSAMKTDDAAAQSPPNPVPANADPDNAAVEPVGPARCEQCGRTEVDFDMGDAGERFSAVNRVNGRWCCDDCQNEPDIDEIASQSSESTWTDSPPPAVYMPDPAAVAAAAEAHILERARREAQQEMSGIAAAQQPDSQDWSQSSESSTVPDLNSPLGADTGSWADGAGGQQAAEQHLLQRAAAAAAAAQQPAPRESMLQRKTRIQREQLQSKCRDCDRRLNSGLLTEAECDACLVEHTVYSGELLILSLNLSECPICMDDIAPGQAFVQPDCDHMMHLGCFMGCLSTTDGYGMQTLTARQCPVCRAHYPTASPIAAEPEPESTTTSPATEATMSAAELTSHHLGMPDAQFQCGITAI